MSPVSNGTGPRTQFPRVILSLPSQQHLLGFLEPGGPRQRGTHHGNGLRGRLPIYMIRPEAGQAWLEGNPMTLPLLFSSKGTPSFREPPGYPSLLQSLQLLTSYSPNCLPVSLSIHQLKLPFWVLLFLSRYFSFLFHHHASASAISLMICTPPFSTLTCFKAQFAPSFP